MKDILGWCNKYNSYFWEYVAQHEESDIWDYLYDRWVVMKKAIEDGLDHEGVLPGGLNVRRKAYSYYQHAMSYQNTMQRRVRGERRRRHHRHGSHLRLLRSASGRALSDPHSVQSH